MVEELVRDPSALWARQAPAVADEVARLAATLPALPPDYLAFLAVSNGGEGDLGCPPGWFSLWPAAEVVDLNREYAVADYLPGYTGFGSNGGDELLAFAPSGAVVMVPFIPMDPADAVEIAPDFTSLARAFGRGSAAI